jgi:chromosome segregation ATPase
MSSIAGKEDTVQRRLAERDQEIRALKEEQAYLRRSLQEQAQLAQAKAQEAGELMEDIQTLTRENKFVSTEFAKATQANEFLRRHAEELADRERLAQQSLRALELEKHDVLSNYRTACLEGERLNEAVHGLTIENKEAFNRLSQLEKELHGSHLRQRELEAREASCISEIHTLERHIDHLTHQLELAHSELRDLQLQRDAVVHDIQTQRQLSHTLELSSQDMQRYLAQLEADKVALKQQMLDYQREAEVARKQVEMERGRCAELERVVANERRSLHSRELDTSGIARENHELKLEIDRLTLRNESLQGHINSLQRYKGGHGVDVGALQEENEQLKDYVIKYEMRIRELEEETNNNNSGGS